MPLDSYVAGILEDAESYIGHSTEFPQKILQRVYLDYLIRLPYPPESGIPTELWQEFEEMKSVLTRVPGVDRQGSVEASTAGMSDPEADALLTRIKIWVRRVSV